MITNQITTATNIQAPDLSGAQNNTSKFFNNFFAKDFSIGVANDIIVAFFEEYTGNATAGKALAGAVIYTAQSQNLDPLAVMAEFKKLTQGELNNYLAAFLNFNRVPTSQIGIKTKSTTSPFIQRTILL